jgi:hypothetical protein
MLAPELLERWVSKGGVVRIFVDRWPWRVHRSEDEDGRASRPWFRCIELDVDEAVAGRGFGLEKNVEGRAVVCE